MSEFVVKKIINSNMETELENVGFDKSYLKLAVDKYNYLNLKIYSLTLPQANILKQTALSFGADCAIHKDVLVNNIEKTDCVLSGTISQLKKISLSLENQQFRLSELANEIINVLSYKNVSQTKLAGILNITENSFSDGGIYLDIESAKIHLQKLIAEGADIIDIGAESTKPFSSPVSDEVQLERLLPILDYINTNGIKIPISIDTRSSFVAQRCIKNGVAIINDVSGFDFDDKMIEVIKNSNAKIILQHSNGTPDSMQISPTYVNLIDEIFLSLKSKLDYALSQGIPKNRIILDVGVGFGKKREHNFELIKRIEEFKTLGCELMVGISRKSFLEFDTNEEKDIYTVALSTLLINSGVDYLRVHNVKMHKDLINLMKNFGE